jgi:hypothetical protein
MRHLNRYRHGAWFAGNGGEPGAQFRQADAGMEELALTDDLASAAEHANLMPLRAPVDAGKPLDHICGHCFSPG